MEEKLLGSSPEVGGADLVMMLTFHEGGGGTLHYRGRDIDDGSVFFDETQIADLLAVLAIPDED